MKFFKLVLIAFLITCLDQTRVTCGMWQPASNLYTKSIDHNHPQAAARLTQESFISPEMQWAVLSFMGNSSMVIDISTGQVENMPTLDMVLSKIGQQLRQPSWTSAQKESAKNALHAFLEATEIALFVSSVEKVYQDQNIAGYQDVNTHLTTTLNGQKQSINNSLSAVNAKAVSDGQSSSYFSWIPYFGSGNAQQPAAMSSMSIPVNLHAKTVAIPAQLMPTIIKSNDYKQMPDAAQAANLLFKQCFIAQQHHLKDTHRLNNLLINLQGNINDSNYIFTNFPEIYNKFSNSYPICDIAQKIVESAPARYNINTKPSPQQLQAHVLLLHIRQAIQTALFIANRKSSYNVGYLFSSSITSYLEPIVSQLLLYDAQLATLCKDPLYGATAQDNMQEAQWSTVSKVAAGVIVVGAIIATVHTLNPALTTGALNYASSTGSTASGYVTGAAKSLVPSTVSNWWGSAPASSTSPAADTQKEKDLSVYGSHLDATNAKIFKNQQAVKALQTTKNSHPSLAGSIDRDIADISTNQRDLVRQRSETQNKIYDIKNPTAQTPPSAATDKGWLATAADYGGKAGALAAITMTGLGAAQTAEEKGLFAPGSVEKYTGGYSDTIKKAAISAAVIGGAAAAVGGATAAWYGMNGFWTAISFFNTTKGAIEQAQYAAAFATAQLSNLVSQQQLFNQHNQRSPQSPTQQIAPQQIYEALTNMMHDAPQQGNDPFATLIEGIKIVVAQNMADAPTMLMILQKLQQDNAANPDLAQNIGQLIISLGKDLQGQQAA